MQKNHRVLPLAFASNDNGVTMLGITLYSLLASKRPETKYRIYILEDNISTENQTKIAALNDSFDCEIIFLSVNHLLKNHAIRSYDRFPVTACARLFLPSLLTQENRALYLDIDLLIKYDLSEIFQTELGSALMGVVYERQAKQLIRLKEKLHIPSSFPYFNSGVLFMNLEQMRQKNSEKELLNFMSKHTDKLSFPDQDALNAVLYYRVKGLHPKWNWASRFTRRIFHPQIPTSTFWGNCSISMAREAASSPCIIHFIGPTKPTDTGCCSFYKKEYRKVWLKSPWKNIQYRGKRSARDIRRQVFYSCFDLIIKMRIGFFKKFRRGCSSSEVFSSNWSRKNRNV